MWGFVRDIIVVEDLEGFRSEKCACLRIYYGCCLSLQDLLGAALGLLEIPPCPSGWCFLSYSNQYRIEPSTRTWSENFLSDLKPQHAEVCRNRI